VLDTDRDETEVGTNTDADVLDEEALPRVTEPKIPEEERTKPEGIKLRDEARFAATDVVLNKPAGLEAEHADT
jgi:hypothetical protein